jgi:hypothetical protein
MDIDSVRSHSKIEPHTDSHHEEGRPAKILSPQLVFKNVKVGTERRSGIVRYNVHSSHANKDQAYDLSNMHPLCDLADPAP